MSMKAYRSGETARDWSRDPYDETCRKWGSSLQLEFKMPSKGGGVTEVQFRITSESFDELAKTMMPVDRYAAIRAFGGALSELKSEL